jgi:membrane dipeptidase
MSEPTTADLELAKKLHQKMIVVDAHHDIAMDVLHQHQLGKQGVLSSSWGKMLHTAGINIQVLPLFIYDSFVPELGLRTMLRQLEAVQSDLAEDDSVMRLATSLSEIDSALAENKIAGVLAIEGCDGLSGDPALLRLFYRLGVRMVSFTWNRRNEFADGLGEGPNAGGLSKAGKTALREMNEHHILCDVSHLSVQGFWDVAKLCQGTFVASHCNAHAICDHPRNLTDEQLRAVAESGGVVGLNFYGGFVDAENPTVAKLVDHLAHIADTIGIDHVGLGTDLLEDWLLESAMMMAGDALVDASMIDFWMPECRRIEQLPTVTVEMLARGFSEADIEKVLGGNFMRVFRQVWT